MNTPVTDVRLTFWSQLEVVDLVGEELTTARHVPAAPPLPQTSHRPVISH